MADISPRQIEQLQRAFARPERLQDGAMLAGAALALPIMAVRGRQARLEAVRTERRLGRDHPETQARRAAAQSLAGREQQLRKDVARQQLTKPAVDDQAGLYGRVTRRGEPQPGLVVNALGENDEAVAHSCTGSDGGYGLAFPPGQPVRIEVRDENRRLFRDETGLPYPPYRATYRDIELSRAKPICPDDKPAEPGGRIQMPNFVSMKEAAAVRNIEGLGLRVGKRRTRKAREAGLVLDHQPEAGATVKAGQAVELTVSTADDSPAARVPDLTGKSLYQATEAIKESGAEVGAVNVRTDGGRTPLVREARPTETGEKVDLDISTTGGDAQLMSVVATVIAASPEGEAMKFDSRADASEWLRKHRLTSLEEMQKVEALDDAALRKRMRLTSRAPVAPVRSLLLAGIGRVRKI